MRPNNLRESKESLEHNLVWPLELVGLRIQLRIGLPLLLLLVLLDVFLEVLVQSGGLLLVLERQLSLHLIEGGEAFQVYDSALALWSGPHFEKTV